MHSVSSSARIGRRGSPRRRAISCQCPPRLFEERRPASARLVGALFEMCWTFVPVAASFMANASSHFLPDALDGSNSPPGTYMLSSVTSPRSDDRMSRWVTPGKVSFVNCGKSIIVISPYFCFICADVWPPVPARPAPPPRPAARSGFTGCWAAGGRWRAAAAAATTRLEQLAQRPRVGGDAIQLVLLAEDLGRRLLA